MVTSPQDHAEVFRMLSQVKDPELPALDIVELGIVRGVTVDGSAVLVEITPTYSGCPAMQVIESEITTTLRSHGFSKVEIITVFSPPWSSDWISEAAREKLRRSGIAPPRAGAANQADIHGQLVTLTRAVPAIECPFCGSSDTRERSEFGSTACKAIYVCGSCRQPFDYFKHF